MNLVIRLNDPIQVDEHWDFFLEGMTALNNPKGANAKYTNESFFRLLCRVVAMGPTGIVAVFRSKNDKNLGFCVAFKATTFMAEDCMFMAEVYSNGKDLKATLHGLEYVADQARRLGLSTLKTATRRFSGSSLRLFEDRWGFTREHQTFTKSVA